MKPILLFTFLLFFSQSFAQEEASLTNSHFGISLNAGYQRGLGTLSVGPSLYYFRNNHEFGLGVNFHPADRRFQTKYGGELIYKYFPEGIDKRFNQFYIASMSITYNDRFQTMWSGDYRRKELNVALLGGLGAQMKLSENAYLAASLSVGASTYDVDAYSLEIYSYPMFQYYEFEVAPRISLGVRL